MNNYNFIGIDEGKQNILRFQTNPKKIMWKKDLSFFPTARALQQITENLVLVGYDKGYFIIDIFNGNIVHNYNKLKQITSAIRLKNGNTLLTSMNIEGEDRIGNITLDTNDKIIKVETIKGDYVRLMTLSPSNSYLFCTNTFITETDNTLRIFYAKGFQHAWQSKRLSDGKTIVSAGYGAFMAVFDKVGNLEKTFGEKDLLPKNIEPYFYASFQIAKDDTILVANWQGHGPNNGNKGKQLIQFDSEGKYIDGISFEKEISSLQGLLILE